MRYCNIITFPVTSKVREYNCQNSNYIAVTDPSNAVLLGNSVFVLVQISYDDDVHVHVPIYIFLQEGHLMNVNVC